MTITQRMVPHGETNSFFCNHFAIVAAAFLCCFGFEQHPQHIEHNATHGVAAENFNEYATI